mgnify:FL=1
MINKTLNFKKLALAVMISSALVGCNSSGGSSNDGGSNDPEKKEQQVTITGVAVKGLLKNATVKAYALADMTELAEVMTGDDGAYSLPKLSHQGAILVELTTNENTMTVCDSATGCAGEVAFGTSYAFNDSDFKLTSVLPSASKAENQKLMVTPVTHLAAQRVLESKTTKPSEIQGYVDATAKLLGLEGSDINTLVPVDITNPTAVAAASKESQVYGALVGAIATIAKSSNKSLASVLETLSDDYSADGGLVGNSSDSTKITLDKIFESAGEVAKAAVVKAGKDNVTLNLDAAEMLLKTEEQGAEQEEANDEVIEDVTPDPIDPVDPVDPVGPTDADKLVTLLGDITVWNQALSAASDKGIYQPFEDQLLASSDLVTALADQSSFLSTTETMFLGSTEEVFACWDGGVLPEDTSEAACLEAGYTGDFDTESEDSGFQRGIGATFGTVELVAFFERYYRLQGTAPTATELTLDDAIALGYDGDFILTPDEEGGVDDRVNTVTITPVYDDLRMVSAHAEFTHTNPGEQTAEFAMDVSRDEGSTSDTDIKYLVNNVTGFINDAQQDSEDYYFNGDGGSVNFKFATASALQDFLGETDSGDYQELKDLVELDFSLNLAASNGSIDGSSIMYKLDTRLDGSFVKAQGSNSLASAEVSITIDSENTVSNESLSGVITLNADGSILEEANVSMPNEMLYTYFANAVAAEFEGDITVRTDDSAFAMFDGSASIGGKFIPKGIDPNNEVEEQSISFTGDFSVMDAAGLKTAFVGDINATIETLLNADGSPYILDGETHNVLSDAGLIGTLMTETAAGAASVSLNAALAIDYSKMLFPAIHFPYDGMEAAVATYSLKDGIKTPLVEGQDAQLSSITLSVDVETGINGFIDGLNTQLPSMDAESYFDNVKNAEFTISLANCSEMEMGISGELQCELLVDGSVVNNLQWLYPENTLINTLNSFQFQQHEANYQLFNPSFLVWTDFGDVWLNRAEYMEVLFVAPDASGVYSVNESIVVTESDFEMDVTNFVTEESYPTITASLQMDAALVGIEDGEIKLLASNTDSESFTGSALFSYGESTVKLEVDSDNFAEKDKTFITFSNGDMSLKLVATCATDGGEQPESIAVCEGDLTTSGDVFIDDSGEKVAVIEDRDGAMVIKFVSGDSYGVVMTPNFGFVKQ